MAPNLSGDHRMTTDLARTAADAAKYYDVARLNEAMVAALCEARMMASRADLGAPFAELLMHINELHDLMNDALAQFDPAEVGPLLALSAQMRDATQALVQKIAN
jgi:hypothetical protein